jgi:integrase
MPTLISATIHVAKVILATIFILFAACAGINEIHAIIDFGVVVEATKAATHSVDAVVSAAQTAMVVYDAGKATWGWFKWLSAWYDLVPPERRIDPDPPSHPEQEFFRDKQVVGNTPDNPQTQNPDELSGSAPDSVMPPASASASADETDDVISVTDIPAPAATLSSSSAASAVPSSTNLVVGKPVAPTKPLAPLQNAASKSWEPMRKKRSIRDTTSSAVAAQKDSRSASLFDLKQFAPIESSARSKVTSPIGETVDEVYQDMKSSRQFYADFSDLPEYINDPFSQNAEDFFEYMFTPSRPIGDIQFTGYRMGRCSRVQLRSGLDMFDFAPRTRAVREFVPEIGKYLLELVMVTFKRNIDQPESSFFSKLGANLSWLFYVALMWLAWIAFWIASTWWQFLLFVILVFILCYKVLGDYLGFHSLVYPVSISIIVLFFPVLSFGIVLWFFIIMETKHLIVYWLIREATNRERLGYAWFNGGPNRMPCTMVLWKSGIIQAIFNFPLRLAMFVFAIMVGGMSSRDSAQSSFMVWCRALIDSVRGRYGTLDEESSRKAFEFANAITDLAKRTKHGSHDNKKYQQFFDDIVASESRRRGWWDPWVELTSFPRIDGIALDADNNGILYVNADDLRAAGRPDQIAVACYLLFGNKRSETFHLSGHDILTLNPPKITKDFAQKIATKNAPESVQAATSQVENKEASSDVVDNRVQHSQESQQKSAVSSSPAASNNGKRALGNVKQEQRSSGNANADNKNPNAKPGSNSFVHQLGNNICHSVTATAMIVLAATHLVKIVDSPHEELKYLADPNNSNDDKIRAVAEITGTPLDGTPRDAQHILIDALPEICCYFNCENLGVMLNRFVRVTCCSPGTSQASSVPKNRKILGAIKYYPGEVGHWTFVAKSKSGKTWIEVNNGKSTLLGPNISDIATGNEETGFVWLDNGTRNGNGEATFSCSSCKKEKSQHAEKHVARTCKCCNKILIGPCTGISKANRAKKVQSNLTQQQIEDYTCPACAAVEKKKQLEEQQQAAKQKQQDAAKLKQEQKKQEQKQKQEAVQQKQEQQKQERKQQILCTECSSTQQQHGGQARSEVCSGCKKTAFGNCCGSASTLNSLFGSKQFVCTKCLDKEVKKYECKKVDNGDKKQQQHVLEIPAPKSKSQPSKKQQQSSGLASHSSLLRNFGDQETLNSEFRGEDDICTFANALEHIAIGQGAVVNGGEVYALVLDGKLLPELWKRDDCFSYVDDGFEQKFVDVLNKLYFKKHNKQLEWKSNVTTATANAAAQPAGKKQETVQQQKDKSTVNSYVKEYKKKNPTPPSRNPPPYASDHSSIPQNLPPHVAAARQRLGKFATADVTLPDDFEKKPQLGAPPKVVKTPEELNAAEGDAVLDNTLEQDFQGRSGNAPATAIYRGKFLHDLQLNKQVPKEVANARHPGTFQNHFRCLRYAKAMVLNSPKEWQEIPLVTILIRVLNLQAVHRKWKPQTTFREACSMQGAFNGLQIYSNQKFQIELADSYLWRLAMAIWRLAAQQNQPHNQTVVSALSILEAINATDPLDIRTKAALILQWFLAGRAGDVLKLRKEDLVIDAENGFIAATFNHAKTVAKRGAYTVKTAINNKELLVVLQEYLNTIPNEKGVMVFPLSGPNGLSIPRQEERMRMALKFKDPALTTRSIRRGALQAMAKNGVDEATLMHFSGHKDRNTLLRYLDWGRNFSKEEQSAHEAAQHLNTTTSQEEEF